MKSWLNDLFKVRKPIIAMCHMHAFPGDPGYDAQKGLDWIYSCARRDLLALQEGGVDAILFSNEFSLPYLTKVETITVACMADIIAELKRILRSLTVSMSCGTPRPRSTWPWPPALNSSARFLPGSTQAILVFGIPTRGKLFVINMQLEHKACICSLISFLKPRLTWVSGALNKLRARPFLTRSRMPCAFLD